MTAPIIPLAAEMLALWHALDNDSVDGEVDPELAERIAAIEADLPNKIDDLVYVIRRAYDYSAECSKKAQRLAGRARMWQGKGEWLESRILATMQAISLKKLKTAKNTVTVCGNGGLAPLILPDNQDAIPVEFLTSKTLISPNVELIREKLAKGVALGFAKLGERGVHLRIK